MPSSRFLILLIAGATFAFCLIGFPAWPQNQISRDWDGVPLAFGEHRRGSLLRGAV